MSYLKIKRNEYKPDWTLGTLFIEGKKFCFTVEDETREVKVHGETAIDAGVYPLATRYSPKFSRCFMYSEAYNLLVETKECVRSEYSHIKDWVEHELIWIQNTPRHEYVLLHWGNTDLDSHGCIILGDSIGKIKGRTGVMNSKKTYKKFYETVYKAIKAGKLSIDVC